jgi:glycosyltransferase involved in cell wall biosynthesis
MIDRIKRTKKPFISAVVLTRNEQEKLQDCLKSIDWLDEIVIVDDSSTDKTLEIAKEHNAKIFNLSTTDFSKKRNLGTRMASGEWVLHLDADERITKELQNEILSLIKAHHPLTTGCTSYAIPRKNYIFGKVMKHCGLWPDYVQHLIKKSDFISWQGVLHETPHMRGEMGYLTSPILHFKHSDLSQMVKKTNEWSQIEASLMLKTNHPKMNLPRFASAMFREFWLRMVRQTAFLDGTEGVIYATYQVWSRFLSYAKLWERQLLSKNSKVKNQNDN